MSIECLNPRAGQNLDVRNVSCSSLFSQMPSIDSEIFISFVLNPLANGQVNMVVKAVNNEPDPDGGFQDYPVKIIIKDANEPPKCTVASEIVVLQDSGPIVIPHFLISGSAGRLEDGMDNS